MTGGFHAPGAKVVITYWPNIATELSDTSLSFLWVMTKFKGVLYWKRVLYTSIHKQWEELSDGMC